MPNFLSNHLLAFCARTIDISSALIESAKKTGTMFLFDISGSDFDSIGPLLLQADASGASVGVKVSPEQVSHPDFERFLSECGIENAWVEIDAEDIFQNSETLLNKIKSTATGIKVIPITGRISLLDKILSEFPEITGIAIKGNEAGGLVSSETTFILYSALRKKLESAAASRDIYIWGGAGTALGAAAFLSAGTKGIIFESVHWLTNAISINNNLQKKIASLRPDHTDVLGFNLGIPFRLFNKGNSAAVRDIKNYAGLLCSSDINSHVQAAFLHRIADNLIHPLESSLGKDELIPLGVEAAFAQSFLDQYGAETDKAIKKFISDIDLLLSTAESKLNHFVDSKTAEQMGTKYPFIQGAMSWITDNIEFAAQIAASGALPTLALGLMPPDVLDEKLGAINEIMARMPYSVNVITLNENPYRNQQLDWIKKIKPRFAVIAAGEPSHAVELQKHGITAMYIAPNEELLRMALQLGIRYVICEGHEAGGHIGTYSTLTMAQIISELRRKHPELLEQTTIILAGGICNRETAFIAAMLGADAVQMGTVYLSSNEIVQSGALSQLYQDMIIDSEPGDTVITGEGTGLRVRSLNTSKIQAICTLEREFASGSESEDSFRRKIEGLSAGSLFTAAKGLDKPGGKPLGRQECIESGQFMSGSCAGYIESSRSLNEIHEELAQGSLTEGLPFTGPLFESEARPDDVEVSTVISELRSRQKTEPPFRRERIAITGMSIVNSLGNSPEEVWSASVGMKSGIIAVPPHRWDHEIFYDPRPRASEKTYCKVGAFQNIQVSRKDIGMPPQDFRTMTDSTRITMWLASNAVGSSGILDSDIPRNRIGVLISQNSGEAAATLQDVIIRGSLNKIVSAVKRVVQLSPEMEHAIEEEVRSGRIAIDDTTLLGRLNCSAGGFICNKYGFMGPSFSVSAACATALVALYSAVQMIDNGIIDAAVVGGAEEFLTPMHFLEFSALGALAGLAGRDRRPDQTSRPFDLDRDGMVLGEGGGMIVIERESIARKRGAKPYAYITAMGASNNNLGMVESSRTTQELAIESSFNACYYGPESVDMIECHATSTRQGDQEEVQALKRFYRPGVHTALTSFKSQIGHTLGASGINSLIRGVMAMNAGVLPATLNCQTPDPELGLKDSGLTVLSMPDAWQTKNGDPRRFQVNAFGFGGSNYVVQVEQAMEMEDTILVNSSQEIQIDTSEPGAEEGFPSGISFFKTEIGSSPYRLSVVSESLEKATSVISELEPFTNGSIPPKRIKTLSRQGIYFGKAEPTPNLAFVFPGQGSHYAGMGHELYETFPVIKEWMDRAAAVADFDLLHLLFHDREEDLQKTRWQQPALFTMEYAMVQYLISLGIKPAALAGHSLGELTALCLSGVYSFEDGFKIVNMRAICMDKACGMHMDPGVMMAVDAPLDIIRDLMSRHDDVYITNLNSPHQIVVGGNSEEVKKMGAELKKMGYRNTLLRVSMAFHSPIMRCIHDELQAFIDTIQFYAPEIPVISNTTKQPFPNDTSEIKRIVMAHLESPVHWMDNVKSLWNDYNVRLFVEIGPREILSNLIADTIEEAECIQTCLPSAETTVYNSALAQLYAKGCFDVGSRAKYISVPSSSTADKVITPISATPVSKSVVAQGKTQLELIIQREINGFVLESFGRFLKPVMLAAIKQEYDPHFSHEKLDSVLSGMFPASNVQSIEPYRLEPLPLARTIKAVISTPSVEPAVLKKTLRQVEMEDAGDTTETVIKIIMEATGYDRDEIEPDMDLREDLSIRSSRLPVIMDSVEGHFGIKINLEDFMDVRTIQDISDKISVIVSRNQQKKTKMTAPDKSQITEAIPAEPQSESYTSEIRRVIFKEVLVEELEPRPIEISPMDSVAVFSAAGGFGMRTHVGEIFRRDYGCSIVPFSFNEPSQSDTEGFDLAEHKDRSSALERLDEIEDLAGITIILDQSLEKSLLPLENVTDLTSGLFGVLKQFLTSPSRKFALVVNKSYESGWTGELIGQALLGTFLSAAQEFSGVQFRYLVVDEQTDLRVAIRKSLDRSNRFTHLILKEGQVFTFGGCAEPAECRNVPRDVNGDVVVLSGGCAGIMPAIGRAFGNSGLKPVFIGRTKLTNDSEIQDIIASGATKPDQVLKSLSERRPDSSPSELEIETKNYSKQIIIRETLDQLRSQDIHAEYLSADLSVPEEVANVVNHIRSNFGSVAGVVHGAGVLEDAFIPQLTIGNFEKVVKTKFDGALNLYKALSGSNLSFFTCLSSAASIQGNPGQSNYSAGNRLMSALVKKVAQECPNVISKSFMLPPIAGAGMAENEDIRAFMKRMNAEYVQVEELAELIMREIFCSPQHDNWVLWMRSLPEVPTVCLETAKPSLKSGSIVSGTLQFPNVLCPMIDEISDLDFVKRKIITKRSFSRERDLWVSDHKPFKFLKNPLVSAIMAIETFLETSKVLYPYLHVIGIRDTEFLDILEIPQGMPRESTINCELVTSGPEMTICQLSLCTKESSPTGRIIDRFSDNYRSKVILSKNLPVLPKDSTFSIRPEELDSRPMDHEEVLQWYTNRTDMLGRYRIMQSLDGTSPSAVKGYTVYKAENDFSGDKVVYQYSPYLLEALLQVVNFYIAMRDPDQEKSMIPFRIGEMLFTRKVSDGELIILEARMKNRNEEGITWEARATDSEGMVIMYANDLIMRWFQK